MRYFSSALIVLVAFANGIAQANTFIVVNTNDSGGGSLRQAIINANNTAGADTIQFLIPGAGVQTIAPLTPLPTITEAVTIDGYTQPGSSANTNPTTMGLNTVLKIEFNGAMSGGAIGLEIEADNCTVRGLVINNFFYGIRVFGHNGNVIKGNFVGTDPAGTVARANTALGVLLENGASNTVGGTTPDARNLISGNTGVSNVDCKSGQGNIVQGNLIGTDITGTLALGNAARGVLIESSGSALIGGTTVAARNIISGNTNGDGVQLSGSASTVQGNFIGTDVTGTVAVPNFDGVIVSTNNNIIGGLTATAGTPPGNVISGSRAAAGVLITGGSSNLIQGNIIGADITGTQPLGNHQRGINIVDNGGNPSHDNTIGGTAAGARNIIAFNGTACDGFGTGVSVGVNSGNINNTILGNSIFSNASLGIDLEAAGDIGCGVTANDTGDADTGPNNLQNFPVLETVSNSGGMTTVTGRLNSAPNTMYRIEFFANDPLDPTGYGEGKTFLAAKTVTTNGSGNANFNQSFPQLTDTQFVTSTATDPNGNTSEFSGAVGQLLNVSTRMKVLTGNSVLIGGFIVGGTGSKDIVLRALGPTLGQLGITGFLADPTLDLRNGGGTSIATNDNWKSTQQVEIMATGLQPPNDLEPAIRRSLAPGNYTAIVSGKNSATGVALVEAYDIDKKINPTLTNISTRGFVDIGQNVMIGGFISGNGIVRVIVRALGPTLLAFGVTNVLADPVLDVRDAQGNPLATNDNWADTQMAEIQASGLAPPNSKESAIIIVRPPGNTTAIVTGKNSSTGNALVECYILPP